MEEEKIEEGSVDDASNLGAMDDEAEPCKGATASGKAKAKAKAKAKTAPKPKGKAKAKASPKPKGKAKAKAEPKKKGPSKRACSEEGEAAALEDDTAGPTKRHGRPRKSAVADVDDAFSHPAQRYVYIGRRWMYEVMPEQVHGCSSCRFIFFGCAACVKDTFKGVKGRQILDNDKYYEAWQALPGNEMDEEK